MNYADATSSTVNAKRFISITSPCFLENWPRSLSSLSFRQTQVRWSRSEWIRILLFLKDRDRNGLMSSRLAMLQPERLAFLKLDALQERLDHSLRPYYRGGFVRLGSRSPKDSAHSFRRDLRARTALESLLMILTSRERIRFDLQVAYLAHYEPCLYVREWMDIPRWAEFRCFMFSRELRGISQYHYKDNVCYHSLLSNADVIEKRIREFFPKLSDACHLDDVVFDIAFRVGRDPILIEVNPSPSTGFVDYCLFEGKDLDGRLRYCGDSVSGFPREVGSNVERLFEKGLK